MIFLFSGDGWLMFLLIATLHEDQASTTVFRIEGRDLYNTKLNTALQN